MRPVFAAVAIFWAVVAILVPAGFVHGMFAFDDDIVACFERSFAEVARYDI